MTSKYREYRNAGLCGGCGQRPPRVNKTYCDNCAQKHSAYNKRRRNRHLANNICPTCKTRKITAKRKTCAICLASRQQKRIALRDEVFNAYGGPICNCCGETEKDFLQIDHINGGGNQQLKKIGKSRLYQWLKNNNYPIGYQILCANCNFAKGVYGSCPHQRTKTAIA